MHAKTQIIFIIFFSYQKLFYHFKTYKQIFCQYIIYILLIVNRYLTFYLIYAGLFIDLLFFFLDSCLVFWY